MIKAINIVTHAVPYPPSIGGLVDVFYKLQWLHKMGVILHLHCFTEGDTEAPILDSLCEKVYYYQRATGLQGTSVTAPYIVSSRKSPLLLSRLLSNSYPILFEGIHTTAYLSQNQFSNRQVFVRLFNTEFIYYQQMAANESNWLKKLYFAIEAAQLKMYEKRLAQKATFLPLSRTDENYYKDILGSKNLHFLPVFLPYNTVATLAGSGTYCLYHGNLSVNENEVAVNWLINDVFSKLNIPFVVAGRQPSKRLLKNVRKYKHMSLTADPTDAEMKALITNAHINILPSFNATGVKLKLLNAMFNGRHCLVNAAGAAGSDIEHLCEKADTAEQFCDRIIDLMDLPFTEVDVEKRKRILGDVYNNKKNADLLIKLIH